MPLAQDSNEKPVAEATGRAVEREARAAATRVDLYMIVAGFLSFMKFCINLRSILQLALAKDGILIELYI